MNLTKPFNELTSAELVALSEDQIARYIDLACAEAGVALLPELPEAPSGQPVPDDCTVFGLGHVSIFFGSMEAAVRVANAINAEIATGDAYDAHYISGPSFRKFADPVADAASVSPIRLLSRDTAQGMRQRIEEHERTVKTYNDVKAQREKILAGRRKHESEIRSAVEEAWQEHRRREELCRAFDRYVDLADGNAIIAARFLEKSYGDARELLPALFEAPELATPVEAKAPEPVAEYEVI